MYCTDVVNEKHLGPSGPFPVQKKGKQGGAYTAVLVGNIFPASDPTTVHVRLNQVLGQNYVFTRVHVFEKGLI
jgi:hypothetical protein